MPEGARVLLVLGGSLGARQVNELIAEALPRLAGRVFVIHQTGGGWPALPDTPWYVSQPYFSTEMPDLYAGADLIFGRAGAGTLWEAAAARVPLVLLPLSAGSRGDQVRNAALFEARGAARVFRVPPEETSERTAERLSQAVETFLGDEGALARARSALADLEAAGAAGRIADDLLAREARRV